MPASQAGRRGFESRLPLQLSNSLRVPNPYLNYLRKAATVWHKPILGWTPTYGPELRRCLRAQLSRKSTTLMGGSFGSRRAGCTCSGPPMAAARRWTSVFRKHGVAHLSAAIRSGQDEGQVHRWRQERTRRYSIERSCGVCVPCRGPERRSRPEILSTPLGPLNMTISRTGTHKPQPTVTTFDSRFE